MSPELPTTSPAAEPALSDPAGRALTRAQSLGEAPTVNPRRGKLPGVAITPDRTWVALGWGLATLVVLVCATLVTVLYGDKVGGFIYANF